MASDKNILGCEEQRCIKIEVCCNCLKQNNRLLLWLFGGFGGLDSDRDSLPSMAFNTSKFRTDRAATGPVANTLGPVGRTCPWGSLLGGPRVVFRYFSFLFHRFAVQDRVVTEWVCSWFVALNLVVFTSIVHGSLGFSTDVSCPVLLFALALRDLPVAKELKCGWNFHSV